MAAPAKPPIYPQPDAREKRAEDPMKRILGRELIEQARKEEMRRK